MTATTTAHHHNYYHQLLLASYYRTSTSTRRRRKRKPPNRTMKEHQYHLFHHHPLTNRKQTRTPLKHNKRSKTTITNITTITTILIVLITTIITLNNYSVSSVPQQQSQTQTQSQQANQRTGSTTEHDKQLFKKALNQQQQQQQATSTTSASNIALLSSGSSNSDDSSFSNNASPTSSSSSSTFQCPEQFGYYTDTRDCTKYYVCVFGEVLHESCTGGLRFSRELQTCDWPRNVDCPQLKDSGSQTTTTTVPTTTTTLSSSSSTSPSPSSSSSFLQQTTPSTTLSSSNSNRQSPSNNAKESSSSENNNQPINNSELQQDRNHSSLKGASLVFADEGSDPQQPSFDEAISPVITSDGTIHLHDGSGGTFSLTPNHNRHLQPQQSTDGERALPNVDVFVKPLATTTTNTNANGNNNNNNNSNNNRQRAQHQQLIASSSGSGPSANRQQAASSLLSPTSKLQPATLPNRSVLNQNSNNNQQSFRPELNSNLNSNNNNNDLSDETNDSNRNGNGLSSSSSSSSLDDSDSISSQADQESNENQDSSSSSSTTLTTGGNNGNGEPTSSLESVSEENNDDDEDTRPAQPISTSTNYIPPVTAPNTLRQVAGSHNANFNANSNNNNNNLNSNGNNNNLASASTGRQSSQLLSINNRQVDSRQSFKPILVVNQQQSVQNNNFNNQRGFKHQPMLQATENLMNNNNNNNPDDSTGINQPLEDEEQDQPLVRPLVVSGNVAPNRQNGSPLSTSRNNNNNNNNNQTLSNQHQQHRQQMVAAAAVAAAMQNNRQSRMSNFQQFSQNSNSFNPSASSLNNNELRQQQQQQPQTRFFPTPASTSSMNLNSLNINSNSAPSANPNQQSFLSNNVNFNDSSKLIRLQASQFSDSTPPTDLSSSSANGGSIQNNNNRFQSLPSRSQNVLFSQQPFGFVGDNNNNNNNNNNRMVLAQNNNDQLGNGNFQINNNGQLLQQQRRPRPPKRQQIPSGPPASGSNNNNNRNRQQQIDSRGNMMFNQPTRNNQFMDIDTTTTTTSTTQPSTNSFLSPHDASFMDSHSPTGDANNDNDNNGNLLPLPLPTRGQFSPSSNNNNNNNNRPIVAPTTVNFQQQDNSNNNNNGAAGLGFPTTLPSSSSNGANRHRFNDDLRSSPIRGGVNLVVGGTLANQNQNLNANQLQAANVVQGQLQATRSNLLAAPGQPINDQSTSIGHHHHHHHHHRQQPPQTLSTAAISDTSPSTPTAATTGLTAAINDGNNNNNNNNNNNQEQDPQLVANRYLNSAIDALEAGQPFGTVDYDFDILNDNSTDRRQPATTGFQSASNNNTFANSNNNVQLQPINGNGNGRQRSNNNNAREQQGDGDGESVIGLTNGQPNGNQIGLNLRPSSTSQANGQNQQRIRAQGSAGARQIGGNNVNLSNNQPSSSSSLPTTTLTTSTSTATTSSSSSSTLTNQQPTKKPRPTNRKIAVNHEQALANNRASTEPAKRPEALFSTPIALQTATKCDTRLCRLPDCKCGDTLVPGGLDSKVIPQIVMLTFDDAVNDLNWEIYEEIFTGKTNPNGCPILATFYVSHEWTDYGQVQTLYSRGHEMASHSVTHSFGEKFSKNQWFKEINGQREILNMYGGVKMNDVRGMRAPFLQIGGNKMFEMLYDANFTYDSSMPIFENSPPLWPYTLDYQLTHECMITPCPTKSFPGVWEVGMTMWVDLRGGRCSMGDACSNPSDEDGVYEMLMKNFNRHYKSNRAPFGLFYHSAWFNTVHHRRGFIRFMGTVNSLPDVYFTTNWQMLQWMRRPTPMSEINSFEPWQCPAKNDRPPPCFHPSVCNVKSEHGTRFMKTCQPCPANQQYPWVGATGFKGSKQTNSNGSG